MVRAAPNVTGIGVMIIRFGMGSRRDVERERGFGMGSIQLSTLTVSVQAHCPRTSAGSVKDGMPLRAALSW